MGACSSSAREPPSLHARSTKHQHNLRVLEEKEERAEELRRIKAEKEAHAKAEAASRVNAVRAKAQRARLAKKKDERAAFEARAVTRRQKAATKRLGMMGLTLEASPRRRVRTTRQTSAPQATGSNGTKTFEL